MGLAKLLRGNKRNAVAAYSSYTAAASACAVRNEQSYVEFVIQRTINYQEMTEARGLSYALDAMSTRRLWGFSFLTRAAHSLNVLDFGGAAGAHFHEIRAATPQPIKLRWAVVETTLMASNACAAEQSPDLSFHDSISSGSHLLGKIDVVFSSGALQCLEEPLQGLRALTNLNARWLFLTRLSFSPDGNIHHIVEHSNLANHGPSSPPPPLMMRT